MFVHWMKGSKSRQGRRVRIDKQNLNIIFSMPRWNQTEDFADCQILVAACGVTMLKTTVARNVMSEDLAHLQEMWQTLVKSGDDSCFDACIGCTMDDPFAIAPGVHIQRCALCSLAWHRFCGHKMREMSREKLPAARDGVIASGTAVPEDFVAATTELCLMCRARLHGCAPEDDPEAAPAGGADLEPDSSKLEHNYPPHPQHTGGCLLDYTCCSHACKMLGGCMSCIIEHKCEAFKRLNHDCICVSLLNLNSHTPRWRYLGSVKYQIANATLIDGVSVCARVIYLGYQCELLLLILSVRTPDYFASEAGVVPTSKLSWTHGEACACRRLYNANANGNNAHYMLSIDARQMCLHLELSRALMF